MTDLWQNVPEPLHQCLGFCAAAALLVGISAAWLWPRIGVSLLWSAAGVSLLLPTAATALQRFDPIALRHLPRENSAQFALLAALIGAGTLLQWRTICVLQAADSRGPIRRTNQEEIQGPVSRRLKDSFTMLFQTLAATPHVFNSDALHQSETFFSNVPKTWPQQTDLLSWCQQMTPGVAALLIILGIIYLLFGYQIFKGLVLVNAAIVGAYVGTNLCGDGDPVGVCAVIGAVVAAAIAWPTMKYAVALMGGFFGAMLGASLWRTIILPPNLVWAGALVGLMGFGLLSFILFRGSVMMYTSLQGAFHDGLRNPGLDLSIPGIRRQRDNSPQG